MRRIRLSAIQHDWLNEFAGGWLYGGRDGTKTSIGGYTATQKKKPTTLLIVGFRYLAWCELRVSNSQPTA